MRQICKVWIILLFILNFLYSQTISCCPSLPKTRPIFPSIVTFFCCSTCCHRCYRELQRNWSRQGLHCNFSCYKLLHSRVLLDWQREFWLPPNHQSKWCMLISLQRWAKFPRIASHTLWGKLHQPLATSCLTTHHQWRFFSLQCMCSNYFLFF